MLKTDKYSDLYDRCNIPRSYIDEKGVLKEYTPEERSDLFRAEIDKIVIGACRMYATMEVQYDPIEEAGKYLFGEWYDKLKREAYSRG